jgi:hypothetical protein
LIKCTTKLKKIKELEPNIDFTDMQKIILQYQVENRDRRDEDSSVTTLNTFRVN